MKVMILAAGRGERMRPLSDEWAKPLLPAGGKPLLQWTIENLSREGFEDLVINTSWLGAQIESWLGDGTRLGVRIRYSPEPDGALGTGGGIHNALPLLGDDPFVVVNGDVWTDYAYSRLRNTPSSPAHLVLIDNPAHHPTGDFELNGGLVANGTRGRRFTFAGIGVYHPRLFAACAPGEFPLAPLLREAAGKQLVTGEYHPGRWMDVGTPARLKQLDRQLSEKGPTET